MTLKTPYASFDVCWPSSNAMSARQPPNRMTKVRRRRSLFCGPRSGERSVQDKELAGCSVYELEASPITGKLAGKGRWPAWFGRNRKIGTRKSGLLAGDLDAADTISVTELTRSTKCSTWRR